MIYDDQKNFVHDYFHYPNRIHCDDVLNVVDDFFYVNYVIDLNVQNLEIIHFHYLKFFGPFVYVYLKNINFLLKIINLR